MAERTLTIVNIVMIDPVENLNSKKNENVFDGFERWLKEHGLEVEE